MLSCNAVEYRTCTCMLVCVCECVLKEETFSDLIRPMMCHVMGGMEYILYHIPCGVRYHMIPYMQFIDI